MSLRTLEQYQRTILLSSHFFFFVHKLDLFSCKSDWLINSLKKGNDAFKVPCALHLQSWRMANLRERALRCHGDLHKIIKKTRKTHITQLRALECKSNQYAEHDGKSMQWNKWDFDFSIFLIHHTHPGMSYYQCCCFGERLDLGGSCLYGGFVLSVCFAVTGVARRWMCLADPATESTPPRAPDSKPVLHQATL